MSDCIPTPPCVPHHAIPHHHWPAKLGRPRKHYVHTPSKPACPPVKACGKAPGALPALPAGRMFIKTAPLLPVLSTPLRAIVAAGGVATVIGAGGFAVGGFDSGHAGVTGGSTPGAGTIGTAPGAQGGTGPTQPIVNVPEPATIFLLGFSLITLTLLRRRKVARLNPIEVHLLNTSPVRRIGTVQTDRHIRIAFIALSVLLATLAALAMIFHLGISKP